MTTTVQNVRSQTREVFTVFAAHFDAGFEFDPSERDYIRAFISQRLDAGEDQTAIVSELLSFGWR